MIIMLFNCPSIVDSSVQHTLGPSDLQYERCLIKRLILLSSSNHFPQNRTSLSLDKECRDNDRDKEKFIHLFIHLFTYLFVYLFIQINDQKLFRVHRKKMLNNTNTVNTFRLKLTFEQKKLKNLQKSLTLINIRLKQLNWP